MTSKLRLLPEDWCANARRILIRNPCARTRVIVQPSYICRASSVPDQELVGATMCGRLLRHGIDLLVDIPLARFGQMQPEDMLCAGFVVKKQALESLKSQHLICEAIRRFYIHHESMHIYNEQHAE